MMRITDLTKFGFSMKLANLWKETGIEYLLPLQVESIQQYGLLDGKNLLISAPTSAGKTFCGELAALKAIGNNRKAIMLVPLKALASEKYNELTKRYRKIGLNIIVASSDYPENRRAILEGHYDIAVMVYEMFNSLTVSSLGSLGSVGVIICDEFQLIAMADRGPTYELALTKIRSLPKGIQTICLIGGLDDCEPFSSWFNRAS
jgi:helicase